MPMILTVIAWSLLMGWLFTGIAMGAWLVEPIIGVCICLALAVFITERQRRPRKRQKLESNN